MKCSYLLKGTGQQYHICTEHTGKYTWSLMHVLINLDCKFYVVNPLHLKRSLGLTRGKNDKVDAIRIAHFIKKNYQDTEIFVPKRDVIQNLQILVSERKFRIQQRQQLSTKNKELNVLDNRKLAFKLIKENNKLIKELSVQVKTIEQQIKELIKQDSGLFAINKQLKSIPGIGDVLCWNLIIKTNEFKSIREPRKLACYAGVAPFANTSGTSVFGRNRVSNLADKSLKKLLHLGAMSAIRLNNDLACYYRRKVMEGKNKMSVLNAVRNKIIHIIFALIKNQDFYQNRLVTS
ncbi:transposase [Flavivirga abyssicola]|uniref:transposase n=1 Tax=Flavivirga abyssicola TaxID=3063533 RepID=UPI0026E0EAA5|nr:transposase [Flavivirga sp. MEBiC07777]WVK15378.1 transposase [Flavivirga sp. MEBiC07777]